MWHVTAFPVLDQVYVRANWAERINPGDEFEVSLTVASTYPAPQVEPGSPDHLWWLGQCLQEMTQPPTDDAGNGVHRSRPAGPQDDALVEDARAGDGGAGA
jgi:hypothetical protein